jgi:hypothetical protein
VALLKRSGGATLTNLMRATGWQAHSVRGAVFRRAAARIPGAAGVLGIERGQLVDRCLSPIEQKRKSLYLS